MDFDDYDDAPDTSSASKGAVTVSETMLQYDAERMFDAIVRSATGEIVKACCNDIRKAISDSVRAQIDEKVGALIEQTLATGIQEHDRYGSPIGKPTTLTAIIGKAGEDYLGQRVDERGSVSGYGDKFSRLEYIVKKNVETVIDYKMQSQIKAAVEQAVQQAQAKVADAVVKLLK